MKVALTGATGLVGRFIADGLRAAGDTVVPLSRPEYRLGDRPDLSGCDALVHSALAHVPGRYRGGEGDDPEGFTRANLDGSLALFEAAKVSGVGRVTFLSTRAVYGAYPPGTTLTEDMPPRPDTLYGEVKWQAEQALDALCGDAFSAASIRATGVYGEGTGHKWEGLFADFQAGRPIQPRRSTELHGADLARAVHLLLHRTETGVFNASDILLDRRDLLARVAALTGGTSALPEASDAPVSEMRCDRLRALGWRPSGWQALDRALPDLLKTVP
ncbi:NAD(P)-dependent oxidoreductase [Thalassococcus profundi]|uniref:NAD(P)-dependent oxidoreductase n=1 Tax=Thalassococcus profundi TaxID=2282382 RepID=A0A369TMD4_9RHOB|nr:NAD(P)-dependent oxidoreductase [Thalassococcus profundi]RDD65834.1 NAD(P)-dependent oxidoreductase [Thalassococcus profundi]